MQVPLLLGLGEEERALGAALDSGDADLAHLALFRMQRSLPLQQLLAALAARPAARALMAAYCARMVSANFVPSSAWTTTWHAGSVHSLLQQCPPAHPAWRHEHIADLHSEMLYSVPKALLVCC